MRIAVLYDRCLNYKKSDDCYHLLELKMFFAKIELYDILFIHSDITSVFHETSFQLILKHIKHLLIIESNIDRYSYLPIEQKKYILESILQSNLLTFKQPDLIISDEYVHLLDLYKSNHRIKLCINYIINPICRTDTNLTFKFRSDLYFKRNAIGFCNMIKACITLMSIWKFKNNDFPNLISLLPRDIILIIGKMIWKTRYNIDWYEYPITHVKYTW